MQFTRFGQTGLTVSRMILGTGTFGKQTDEKEAHRMLDKAAEAGINFIDTADVYPPGAEAGLSHMSKEFEEEFFSPRCEVHFACNGLVVGMSSQDIEGDPSQDG